MNQAGDVEGGASKGSSRSDMPGKVWSVYLSEADKKDKSLVENWKGDSEGILIFTGLFAATVAAFIIESYKQLSSDSGAATVLLLNQISQQLSSLSATQVSSSPPPPAYSDSSFRPTPSAIRVNILWFLSLTLSLTCALVATLMQQWARRYLQQAQTQTTLYKRARMREYLFQGVQAFHLSQAIEAVPALLHIAVFLFFAGLVDFLFSIDSTVGRVILGVLCSFGGIYTCLTFLPNFRPNCPYRTPFSGDLLKWFLVVPTAPVLFGVFVIQFLCCSKPSDKFGGFCKRFGYFMDSLRWTISKKMDSLKEEIDRRALLWTLTTVSGDDDIVSLIEGIPEFLEAGTSSNALAIVKELLDVQQPKPLGHHINQLIQTCTVDGYRGANENLRKHRAIICLNTIRILTAVHSTSFSYEMFGDKIWPSIFLLKQDKDPVIAINAISTGALAACAYLRSVIFNSKGQTSNQTPSHIINLHQLVNASWHENVFSSFPKCHLLILQGFISSLLHHLTSDKVALVNFHVVWETLPHILNMTPLRNLDQDLDQESRDSFLMLWAQLKNLAKTKITIDTNNMPPIIQLISLLHPTFESIQVQ